MVNLQETLKALIPSFKDRHDAQDISGYIDDKMTLYRVDVYQKRDLALSVCGVANLVTQLHYMWMPGRTRSYGKLQTYCCFVLCTTDWKSSVAKVLSLIIFLISRTCLSLMLLKSLADLPSHANSLYKIVGNVCCIKWCQLKFSERFKTHFPVRIMVINYVVNE